MLTTNLGFGAMMLIVLVLTFLTRKDDPRQFLGALFVVGLATFFFLYMTNQLGHHLPF